MSCQGSRLLVLMGPMEIATESAHSEFDQTPHVLPMTRL